MVKVAGIQMRSVKAEVEVNRQNGIQLVKEAAANGAKLICLPELWVTGYGMDTDLFQQLCETVEGPTVSTFQRLAKQLNIVLIVPFPERIADPHEHFKDSIFISAAVIDADGTICGVYQKSMLWGAEKNTFIPGIKDYVVYDTAAGKVGVLICYDIEFPEPARLLALGEADIIFVPSVWSKQAEPRWDIQLPARALDNSLYVMGVNAVGGGACGKTKFIGPDGSLLEEASPTEEEIIYGQIDQSKLMYVREKIPYRLDYPEEFTPRGLKAESEESKGA